MQELTSLLKHIYMQLRGHQKSADTLHALCTAVDSQVRWCLKQCRLLMEEHLWKKRCPEWTEYILQLSWVHKKKSYGLTPKC